MRRARLLVWLLALMALAFPVGIAAPSRAHHATMSSDCPHKDTAKHAASICCPLMACTAALLPASDGTVASIAMPHVTSPSRRLTGLTYGKDPPPPRV